MVVPGSYSHSTAVIFGRAVFRVVEGSVRALWFHDSICVGLV